MNLTAEVVGLVITVVLVETYIAAQKDKRESAKLEIGEGGVYFIVNLTAQDEQKHSICEDYIKAVKSIAESYGGQYLVHSGAVKKFIGENPDRVIVIKFSDRHRLEACFSSPEYKQIECLLTADVTANAFIVGE